MTTILCRRKGKPEAAVREEDEEEEDGEGDEDGREEHAMWGDDVEA